MDKSKILTIVTAILGVIGIFFFVRVLMAGDDTAAIDGAASGFVNYGYYLLIIAVIIAVLMSVLNLIRNPKALKKSLAGVLILGVLLAISYFTASGDAVTDALGNVIKDGEAGEVSKWISALITFTFILGTITLIAIVGGFVKSLIK
ncbi:MAG: hypothetical protein R2821_02110 [Flavobacteriaceae bacterium]|jgi:hypothetical protein|nr:hypothetical protein [Flavobacteriaceae bacterium]